MSHSTLIHHKTNPRHNGTQSSVQVMLAAPDDLLHNLKSTLVEPVRIARPSGSHAKVLQHCLLFEEQL